MILEKRKMVIIFLCLYFVFQVNAINVVYYNEEHRLILSSLLGCMLIVTATRHIFNHIAGIKYLLPILELILLFSVNYLDVTTKSQFLLMIIIADVVLAYSLKYSLAYSAVGYGIFLYIFLLKMNEKNRDNISQAVTVSLITYFSVLFIFFIIKNQIIQNMKYKQLTEELVKKTAEIEELAVFKERSRIAGEIHDTVGHTLTTVLIEIEAGRMLIDKNPELAKEKIRIAKDQVKKGLESIRSSVKAIQKGEDLLGFEASLRSLFKELQQSTGSRIDAQISIRSELLPLQEKVIYHGIQEALTNGLKHGNATEFQVNILEKTHAVEVEIIDNGHGVSEIRMGFGLTNMTEKVKSIGGKANFSSSPSCGFQVRLVIPIGKE